MWYVVLTFKDDIFRSYFLRSFIAISAKQVSQIRSILWRDNPQKTNNRFNYLKRNLVSIPLLISSSAMILIRLILRSYQFSNLLIQPTISLEMSVPNQGHYDFHSCPVIDWFCLFKVIKSFLTWRKNELRTNDIFNVKQ
jgi:hypothetical protein